MTHTTNQSGLCIIMRGIAEIEKFSLRNAEVFRNSKVFNIGSSQMIHQITTRKGLNNFVIMMDPCLRRDDIGGKLDRYNPVSPTKTPPCCRFVGIKSSMI